MNDIKKEEIINEETDIELSLDDLENTAGGVIRIGGGLRPSVGQTPFMPGSPLKPCKTPYMAQQPGSGGQTVCPECGRPLSDPAVSNLLYCRVCPYCKKPLDGSGPVERV